MITTDSYAGPIYVTFDFCKGCLAVNTWNQHNTALEILDEITSENTHIHELPNIVVHLCDHFFTRSLFHNDTLNYIASGISDKNTNNENKIAINISSD